MENAKRAAKMYGTVNDKTPINNVRADQQPQPKKTKTLKPRGQDRRKA